MLRSILGFGAFAQYCATSNATNYIDFMMEYYDYLDSKLSQCDLTDKLLHIAKRGAIIECVESGYSDSRNNYSFAYISMLLPISLIDKCEQEAENDHSIVMFITPWQWEIETRLKEPPDQLDIVKRNMSIVTYDTINDYHNFMMSQYPLDGLYCLKHNEQIIEEITERMVSVKIKYHIIGNHIDWILAVLTKILG